MHPCSCDVTLIALPPAANALLLGFYGQVFIWRAAEAISLGLLRRLRLSVAGHMTSCLRLLRLPLAFALGHSGPPDTTVPTSDDT